MKQDLIILADKIINNTIDKLTKSKSYWSEILIKEIIQERRINLVTMCSFKKCKWFNRVKQMIL